MKLLTILAISLLLSVATAETNQSPKESLVLSVPEQYSSQEDKLKKIVTNSSVPDSLIFNLREIDPKVHCLAVNAYYEARGESLKGVASVVEVVKNRKGSQEYPDTACGVVADKKKVNNTTVCQFSWFCKIRAIKTPVTVKSPEKRIDEWRKVVTVVLAVEKGLVSGFVGDATHFYNHKLSSPSWARRAKNKYVVNNHTFLEM